MATLKKSIMMLLAVTVCLSMTSCGNSFEERYIDLLEQRLDETVTNGEGTGNTELTPVQVTSEVTELMSFLCPFSSKSLVVRSKRLSSKKWLVNISYQTQQLDEFGFPVVLNANQICHVINGELEVDPILKLQLPCD